MSREYATDEGERERGRGLNERRVLEMNSEVRSLRDSEGLSILDLLGYGVSSLLRAKRINGSASTILAQHSKSIVGGPSKDGWGRCENVEKLTSMVGVMWMRKD